MEFLIELLLLPFVLIFKLEDQLTGFDTMSPGWVAVEIGLQGLNSAKIAREIEIGIIPQCFDGNRGRGVALSSREDKAIRGKARELDS